MTGLLMLFHMGMFWDIAAPSTLLVALGLICLHSERAFAVGDGPFSRQRFGLAFFWSGQALLAAGLLLLLGAQIAGDWLYEPFFKQFYQACSTPARRPLSWAGANPGPDPGPGGNLRLRLFRPDRPPRGRLHLPGRLRLAVGRSAGHPIAAGADDDGSGDHRPGPDGAGGQSVRPPRQAAGRKPCGRRGRRLAGTFTPALAAGRACRWASP